MVPKGPVKGQLTIAQWPLYIDPGKNGTLAQFERDTGVKGILRLQAGDSEELLTDVLDLDAVTRVRRFGTAGVSRMWDQIEREGSRIHLPMYGGSVRPRPGR